MSTVEAKTAESAVFIPEEWQHKYKDLSVTKSDKFLGERYYGVEIDSDNKVRIPRDEWETVMDKAIAEAFGVSPIEWSDEEIEKFSSNPELWQAHKEMALMRTDLYSSRERERLQSESVAGLAERIEALSIEKEEYETTIERLRSEVSSLGARIATLESREYDVHVAETPRFVEVSAPEPERADEVDGAPLEREAVVAEQPPNSPSNRSEGFKKRWNSMTGKLGNAILGWQVRAQNGVYRVIDRRNRTITVEEEVSPGEYPYSSRRAGVVAIAGGVAVVATGVICYLLGKHAGHDNINQFNEIIAQNNTIKGQNNHLLSEAAQMKDQVNGNYNEIEQLQHQVASLQEQVGNDVKLDKQILSQTLTGGPGGSGGSGSNIYGSFHVQRGSGIINEIQEYARSRGRSVSGNRAYEIYRQLRSHFGTHIINIDSTTNDTYRVGSDIRLSRPGTAHWFPKAGAMLKKIIG